MYYAKHRVSCNGDFVLSGKNIVTFQLKTHIYFLNPARRRRDGVKEDCYVYKIYLPGFFCFGA